MSGLRGDARKRQQGEHLTHHDAGVRAIIEREVAKAKAETDAKWAAKIESQVRAEAWARDHYQVIRSHGCDDPAPECACGSPMTPHLPPADTGAGQ